MDVTSPEPVEGQLIEPQKSSLLTPRQERFVEAFCSLQFDSAAECARAAGYSQENASQEASRLLRSPRVVASIRERLDGDVINALYLKALRTTSRLMTRAKSEKVQLDAALKVMERYERVTGALSGRRVRVAIDLEG